MTDSQIILNKLADYGYYTLIHGRFGDDARLNKAGELVRDRRSNFEVETEHSGEGKDYYAADTTLVDALMSVWEQMQIDGVVES